MRVLGPAEHLDVVAFDGGLLIHRRDDRTAHVLNSSAAAVWFACDGTHDARGVAHQIVASVGASGPDAATVEREVHAAIDELRSQGLVAELAGHDAAIAGPGEPLPSSPNPSSAASPADLAEPPALPDLAELAELADLPDLPPAADVSPPTIVGTPTGARLDVVSLGRRATIHLEEPSDRDLLLPLLGPLLDPTPGTDPDERYLLTRGPHGRDLVADGVTIRSGARDDVLRHLLWHLNHRAIDRHDQHLLLHAGAVAGARGAVLIVGEPDAGKSTLTAAGLAAGLTYLTDEAVLVRNDGVPTVDPYPKAISLDEGSLRLLGLDPAVARLGHVAPGELGRVGTASFPVAAVVLPDRDTHAVTERLDPPRAAMRLAAQAFTLHRAGVVGLEALATLAEEVPVLVVPTADLGTATGELRRLAA